MEQKDKGSHKGGRKRKREQGKKMLGTVSKVVADLKKACKKATDKTW